MRRNQLIQAYKRGDIICRSTVDGKFPQSLWNGALRSVIEEIKIAESFTLDLLPMGDSLAQVMETGRMLADEGLLNLPHEYCWFEAPLNISEHSVKLLEEYDLDKVPSGYLGLLAFQLNKDELNFAKLNSAPEEGVLRASVDAGDTIFQFFPFYRLTENKKKWLGFDLTFAVSANKLGLSLEDQNKSLFMSPFKHDKPVGEYDSTMSALTALVAGQIIIASLVLLHTKGVRAKVERPSTKHRRKLLERDAPINGHTTIFVREAIESSTARGPAGERHRPRLHIRRGHIKRQRFGPGHKYTKRIWIKPTLVGYEEEGTIVHEDHWITTKRNSADDNDNNN